MFIKTPGNDPVKKSLRTMRAKVSKVMRSKLIYISSTSYTGSTLLSILMGSHREIVTISELTGILRGLKVEKYVCSCQKPIVQCPFWNKVKSEFSILSGRKLDISNFDTQYYWGNRLARNLLYRSIYSTVAEELRDKLCSYVPRIRKSLRYRDSQNEHLIQACLNVSGKLHFLDASKDPSRIMHLSRLGSRDLYVIHLIRDVRGFANSSRKNRRDSPSCAARQWRRTHLEIERLAGRLKLRNHSTYIKVYYEKLCQNPGGVLKQVFRELGVEEDFRWEFNPRDQHLIGNRMRLHKNLDIRLDESWREQLTIENQEKIWKIAGSVAERHGYTK